MPPPGPDDALAVVTDPHSVGLHPALMTDAWARLKEARGQPLRRPHLLQPAHLIRDTPPGACPAGRSVAAGAGCAAVPPAAGGDHAA